MINLYIFNETSRAAAYGIGTYISELMAAIKKNKTIHICLIHLYSDKPDVEREEADGIRHWYIPSPLIQKTSLDWSKKNNLYFCSIIYLLRLEIKDTTALVFHLNSNASGLLAEKLKEAFDCRIIVTLHYLEWSLLLSGNTSYFKRILLIPETEHINDKEKFSFKSYQREKELFHTVDRIICLSEKTQKILQNDYQIKPDKISLIYNGLIDSNSKPDKSLLRKKYHLPPDIPIFFFVGRLDDTKGLKYALRAFKIVLKTFPECHLIVSGDGDFKSHMKECEDIWIHITWTGFVSKEKMYDLYSIADIGLMPSISEQCSYVGIEMMMHGIPLIASTATGEMIKDGITGLHIPLIEYTDQVEINSEIFAEKIIYILKNPKVRKRMANNARKRYEQLYSSEIFSKNMINFYRSLFNGIRE